MKVQNDLSKGFSPGTKWVHWLTTIFIFILFPMGLIMEEMEMVDKISLVQIHALLGFIVLIFTTYRTYLFFNAPRPKHLNTGSKFNDKLLVFIHKSFYFLLFGLIFSGIATIIIGGYGDALSGGNIDSIKPHEEIFSLEVHGLIAYVLVLFIAMHVIGTIKHYLLTKENTLKRIF